MRVSNTAADAGCVADERGLGRNPAAVEVESDPAHQQLGGCGPPARAAVGHSDLGAGHADRIGPPVGRDTAPALAWIKA